MIEYKKGNMFEERVDALVNAVNCVGAMGRGVALQFKKRFPANFAAYKRRCKTGRITPGHLFVYKNSLTTCPRYIINFPTKRHFAESSKIVDIENGLLDLAEVIDMHHIKSLAMPAVGCGLGGLRWSEIKPMINNALGDLGNVRIIVYEPLTAEEGMSQLWRVGNL